MSTPRLKACGFRLLQASKPFISNVDSLDQMKKLIKTGVIGLGNMGLGMALSLKRAGFEVIGLDREAAVAERAQNQAITVVSSLPTLTAECDVIVLSLPNSATVKSVLTGEHGVFAHAKNLCLIDTTTGDPVLTKELAKHAASCGVRFIEAPVSGGPGGALRGELTIFLGGSDADIETARPFLNALGTKQFHIGDVGAGSIAKLINNLLTAAHLLTASEAFRIAETAGVRIDQLIDAINAGSGRSGVTLFNYPKRILSGSFDSGFTMQLMRKDVKLASDLRERLGIELPIIQQVMDIWKRSSDSIDDGEDFNRIVNFKKPDIAA